MTSREHKDPLSGDDKAGDRVVYIENSGGAIDGALGMHGIELPASLANLTPEELKQMEAKLLRRLATPPDFQIPLLTCLGSI